MFFLSFFLLARLVINKNIMWSRNVMLLRTQLGNTQIVQVLVLFLSLVKLAIDLQERTE